MKATSVLFLLAVTLALLSGPAVANDFTSKRLPPLEGDTHSDAFDVNDKNQAAGRSYNTRPQTPEEEIQTAVVWTARGEPRALELPDGAELCQANAINNHGTVAGACFGFGDFNIGVRAVRWDSDGKATILPPLKGDNLSLAQDINDRGMVVGFSSDGVTNNATIWGGVKPSRLPDGRDAAALAINKKGTILGESDNAEGMVWPKSFRSPRELNDPPSGFALVSGIGAHDWVVGSNVTPGEGQHAILWKGLKSDPMRLRELPDTGTSVAQGINNRNEIVGLAYVDGRQVAVFWNKKGVPYQLPPLEGDEEARADAIGKRGAVGTSGHEVGVLWVRERKDDGETLTTD